MSLKRIHEMSFETTWEGCKNDYWANAAGADEEEVYEGENYEIHDREDDEEDNKDLKEDKEEEEDRKKKKERKRRKVKKSSSQFSISDRAK